MSSWDVGEVRAEGNGEEDVSISVEGGSGWGGDGVNYHTVLLTVDDKLLLLTSENARKLGSLLIGTATEADEYHIHRGEQESTDLLELAARDEKYIRFARDWSLYNRALIDSIFGGVNMETLKGLHDQIYSQTTGRFAADAADHTDGGVHSRAADAHRGIFRQF